MGQDRRIISHLLCGPISRSIGRVRCLGIAIPVGVCPDKASWLARGMESIGLTPQAVYCWLTGPTSFHLAENIIIIPFGQVRPGQ